MIRLIFLAAILSLLAAFSFFNHEEKISIVLFFGNVSKKISPATLAVSAFVAGMLLSACITAPSWIKVLLKQRRQMKRIEQLEEELDKTRAAARDNVRSPSPFRKPSDDLSNDV